MGVSSKNSLFWRFFSSNFSALKATYFRFQYVIVCALFENFANFHMILSRRRYLDFRLNLKDLSIFLYSLCVRALSLEPPCYNGAYGKLTICYKALFIRFRMKFVIKHANQVTVTLAIHS